MYLGISHAFHPKSAEFQDSPILKVLLYLCLHPSTQNDQIWHGDTYGEGRVFTKPITPLQLQHNTIQTVFPVRCLHLQQTEGAIHSSV